MPPNPEETVAANVRHLRIARGLTQGELAEKAGPPLNEQRVWGLENGRRRLTVTDLTALAGALEVGVGKLMSTDPDDLEPEVQPTAHAVQLDSGAVEVVEAHTTELSDGWLNFFLGNERVFFAPADRVLCVRVAGRTGGSEREAGDE